MGRGGGGLINKKINNNTDQIRAIPEPSPIISSAGKIRPILFVQDKSDNIQHFWTGYPLPGGFWPPLHASTCIKTLESYTHELPHLLNEQNNAANVMKINE